MRVLCDVYAGDKKEGTYLYVKNGADIKRLPEALLTLFGRPKLLFPLLLGPDKKLARADVTKVLSGIEEQGYYLQLPPPPEEYLQEINKHNNKLF